MADENRKSYKVKYVEQWNEYPDNTLGEILASKNVLVLYKFRKQTIFV